MNKKSIVKLIISIAIPLAIGGIGAYFTSSAISSWYATLNPPSFNPPNWLFAPVWTTLYIIMGISWFLVWKTPYSAKWNTVGVVYFTQLFLNFMWSIIFFYFHEISWALVDIILLLASIIYMMILFHRIKPLAAWLNIPYLLWVCFATLLNASYLQLNP